MGDCPPGLYCHSHSVCYQSTLHTPGSELTETNIISGMFQYSQLEQSQGGLNVRIIGLSECKVGEEIDRDPHPHDLAVVAHSLQSQALFFFALNTETEETSQAVRLDMKEREGLVRTSPILGPRW